MKLLEKLTVFICNKISILLKVDKLLFFNMIFLMFVGLFFIYGIEREVGGRLNGYCLRQLQWIILGSCVFSVVTVFDYRNWGKFSIVLYIFGIALLVAVLFFGQKINGARSWIPITSSIKIQPSEFTKPATILFAAWFGAMARERSKYLFIPVLVVVFLLPIMLILLQPDLGTVLSFVPAMVAIIFVGGIKRKYIIMAVLAVLIATPIVYTNLKEYQKERILVFIKPTDEVNNKTWNAHNSLLAVGSGGMWGKGYMQGNQHVLGFVAQSISISDFIFSVIAEETGFLGCSILIVGYLFLILNCLRVAAKATDHFGLFLSTGVAAILFIHVFINIAMTVRLAPIIGIPLPLVSYGGSFTIGVFICLGLVQSVCIHSNDPESENSVIEKR